MLRRPNDDGHVQSAATHFAKTSQKYCACHTKRLSTRYKKRLNVEKRHACHAQRSNETFETSKNDPFCRAYHIGTAIWPSRGRLRTVANGCERLRTVATGCERLCERKRDVERTHPQPPDPQSEMGTLATHSGKRDVRSFTSLQGVHTHNSSPYNTTHNSFTYNIVTYNFVTHNFVTRNSSAYNTVTQNFVTHMRHSPLALIPRLGLCDVTLTLLLRGRRGKYSAGLAHFANLICQKCHVLAATRNFSPKSSSRYSRLHFFVDIEPRNRVNRDPIR